MDNREDYGCVGRDGADRPARPMRRHCGHPGCTNWVALDRDGRCSFHPLLTASALRPARACTCHPYDRPDVCRHRYAETECWAADRRVKAAELGRIDPNVFNLTPVTALEATAMAIALVGAITIVVLLLAGVF